MALAGIKVVEFAGLAPGPFAGLVLADNGATVTRIDRPGVESTDILCRGKRSIAISPKVPSGLEALKKLIAASDVLIDPFRPGVLERLGLGPEVFLGSEGRKGINEGLIYVRLAGFPREGPHKDMAGHDLNYLALSGVLSMLPGTPEKPTFPLNLLADFAGGGLMAALGTMLALIERGKTGSGKVVNVDMVSGARYVSSFALLFATLPSNSTFGGARGDNLLDGGAPFYDVYTCKDKKWMSVGCLEPQFFVTFLDAFLAALPEGFSLPDGWRPTTDTQGDRSQWPQLRKFMENGFILHTRDHWANIFFGTDACVLPVLSPSEAGDLDSSRSPFPAPHPQLGQTHQAPTMESLHLASGNDTRAVLLELGYRDSDIKSLVSSGAVSGIELHPKHKL